MHSSSIIFPTVLSGGDNLRNATNEDQTFYTIQRRDAECVSRVGSVSVLMWYATRLMEIPLLEAEMELFDLAEALVASIITGGALGASSFAAFLIESIFTTTALSVALLTSYLDFKDDWSQKGFLTKPAMMEFTSCDPEGDVEKFYGDDPEFLDILYGYFDKKYSKDLSFVCADNGQFMGNPCLTKTKQQTDPTTNWKNLAGFDWGGTSVTGDLFGGPKQDEFCDKGDPDGYSLNECGHHEWTNNHNIIPMTYKKLPSTRYGFLGKPDKKYVSFFCFC